MDKNYSELLHKAGLRLTPQRSAICELLMESHAHPTAKEIYAQLIGRYPSLSLATIYNTLDVLVGMGQVNVLGGIGDSEVHFDSNVSAHINLACVKCIKIVDLQSDLVGPLDSEINQNSGYQILGARVLYYGICPSCQSTN